MLEIMYNATAATNDFKTTAKFFENNIQINSTFPSIDENVTFSNNLVTTDLYAFDAASAIFTDMLVNTTTAFVDYSTEWLTSTIATATANATNISTSSTPYTNSIHGTSTTSATYLSSFDLATDTASNYNSTITHYNRSLNADLIESNNDEYIEEFPPCHPFNPKFNCTIEDLLAYTLGPKTLPLWQALVVTILYGGIFITGILGNVLICVVIVKHQAMHTATNYYLFSLAVSDLIYLIFGLPTEVFLYWHQYPYLFGLPFCKIRAFISEAYVSVFTIVAFSVERYLAICHPLHLYAMSGFKRAWRIIALLWVISFLAAFPFGFYSAIMYVKYPLDEKDIAESAFCAMDAPPDLHLFEISFIAFFFIPMLLIIYFYGRMGAKIHSRTTQQLGVQQGSMHRESRHQQSRKAVIRMLSAVVLTFFICWLPFHAQRLFWVYGQNYKYFTEINEWLFSITGFVYYVSCTVNPILYNVMSHRYRVAFKDTLCGKRKSMYYNNGFARDQSSFRETTVHSSVGTNGVYDRVNSTYGRSFKITNNLKDRSSVKSNNVTWKTPEFHTTLEKEIPENHATSTPNNSNAIVVVCVDKGANGRTKVFTENEAQESLLNKNNETCI